jgi:hypothetical protein
MNTETQEYKHRNCIIVNNPTEQFPDMVKVIKTPKLRKEFLDRRYINIDKAILAIETFESDRLINSKETYVKTQLNEVVVVDDTRV